MDVLSWMERAHHVDVRLRQQRVVVTVTLYLWCELEAFLLIYSIQETQS